MVTERTLSTRCGCLKYGTDKQRQLQCSLTLLPSNIYLGTKTRAYGIGLLQRTKHIAIQLETRTPGFMKPTPVATGRGPRANLA